MLGRLRSPTRSTVHALAVAALVANVVIVVTGGAVRLTSSGLGCPTWPRCTPGSYVTTAELGVHGALEFGNRLLTYVLAAVTLTTLVAALRFRPARRDWTGLAAGLFLGIPAQAIIGGITVLTGLNPWTVMAHFLCSMVLVGLATVLVHRTAGSAPAGAGRGRLLVHPLLHRLALGQLALLGLVIYLGTVVTGSGPHAGDAAAPRTGLNLRAVTQLHADAVFLLVGLTLALLVALVASDAPARPRRAMAVLLGAELAQGLIGFAQYLTGLPVVLVGLHLLGASLLVIAGVRVVLTLRGPAGAGEGGSAPLAHSTAALHG